MELEDHQVSVLGDPKAYSKAYIQEDKRHPRYRDESRGERGFPSKRRSYQKGKPQ